MSMVERLKQDIRLRDDSDYIMPVWLPFISIILVFLGLIVLVGGYLATESFSSAPLVGSTRESASISTNIEANVGAGLLGLSLALIVLGGLIQLYVMYKWIDRRNKHFKRTIMFYRDLAEYFEAKGLSKRAEAIRSIVRQMEVEQSERSAALWVILVLIINILIYYVYHFLTKDFYIHSRRETHIWDETSKAMEELGHPLMYRSMYTIPDRNTVLYFVLSLITLGLFNLYWVYVITNDPNEHFKEHKRFEDELIDKIEKLEESAV
jgi:hypothetical protein